MVLLYKLLPLFGVLGPCFVVQCSAGKERALFVILLLSSWCHVAVIILCHFLTLPWTVLNLRVFKYFGVTYMYIIFLFLLIATCSKGITWLFDVFFLCHAAVFVLCLFRTVLWNGLNLRVFKCFGVTYMYMTFLFYLIATRSKGSTGHFDVLSSPKIRVRNWKLFFLFLNQNICCGNSKEPSRWDGYFEHTKHMFKLMVKKIIAILLK